METSTYIFKGTKQQMENTKCALLKADGTYGVFILDLHVKKVGLFKHQVEATLSGNVNAVKNFINRADANYRLINGDILGLFDYL